MKKLHQKSVVEISLDDSRDIEGGRILPIGPPILIPVLKKLWDWVTG